MRRPEECPRQPRMRRLGPKLCWWEMPTCGEEKESWFGSGMEFVKCDWNRPQVWADEGDEGERVVAVVEWAATKIQRTCQWQPL